jgi:glutamine synthetase
MSQQPTFIEKHGLWSDDERRRAADIKRRVEAEKLRYVRLAWSDTHGYARAKTLTVPAFLSALDGGYNIGVATTTLDSAGARVFASFTRGGGMGLDEMTGSPNLTVVADPGSFRLLPWAPGTGWILCDEYFNDGRPFHFAPRQLLRKALRKLAGRGSSSVIGTESNGICCASPTSVSATTISARPACAAGRSAPRRRSRATTIIPNPTWT